MSVLKAPQISPAKIFSKRVSCTLPKENIPRAMVIENQPVVIKNLNKGGTYQQYNDLKSGKLVGLREDGYTLLQGKNGELIETRLSDHLKGEPYSHYRVVTGKDGKIKSLSESTLSHDIQLTQGANGEIITSRRPLATFDYEAVNAVRRYNGESPLKY